MNLKDWIQEGKDKGYFEYYLNLYFHEKDHLQCGNPDCLHNGLWCYHFTDEDFKKLI